MTSISMRSGHICYFNNVSVLDPGKGEGVKKIQEFLKNHLEERYATPKEKSIISRHWKKIYEQACFNIGESAKDENVLLKPEILQQLCKALEEVVIAIEPNGIPIYPDPCLRSNESAKNFLKYVLYDIPLSKELFTWRNFMAVFVREDPELIGEFREEIHYAFGRLLEAAKSNRHDEKIIELLLGHLLAVYSFAMPKEGVVSIPQKVGGEWTLVEYELTLIPLVPAWIHSPVYATGLVPIERDSIAPSLLLFRGTPYPAAEGSDMGQFVDFVPGCSVGGLMYRMGKTNLDHWITTHNRKIRIYGQSLGGSLAYATALDHPDLVELSVYAPAGLLDKKAHIAPSSHHHRMFCHSSDIVSHVGYHPEGVEMVRIVSDQKRNLFHSHLRAAGAEVGSLLLKVDEKQEKQRLSRKILMILHQIISVPIFILNALKLAFLTALKTLYYLIRR